MPTPLATDSRNRAYRTLLQGLATDVAAALILLLLPVVTNANGWGDFEWRVLGFLVCKTVSVTILSYVMRQYLDRSAFPTPAPPVEDIYLEGGSGRPLTVRHAPRLSEDDVDRIAAAVEAGATDGARAARAADRP
jgi:hypothetical protein